MKNKKFFAVALAVVMAVGSAAVGVMAADGISVGPIVEMTDAIKAADVCEAHLEQNCVECEGYGLDASYAVYCPHCSVKTTYCCSGDCAVDNNYASCLVYTHPDGCATVQDLYWNAYICMECGWYTLGTRADDYHVEAYWHLKDPTCYDNVYCSKPKLDDLRAQVNANTGAEVMTASNALEGAENRDHDAVAAGDYCEVHGIFSCEIPHNDVD